MTFETCDGAHNLSFTCLALSKGIQCFTPLTSYSTHSATVESISLLSAAIASSLKSAGVLDWLLCPSVLVVPFVIICLSCCIAVIGIHAELYRQVMDVRPDCVEVLLRRQEGRSERRQEGSGEK